ncbi:phytanoyl-CoA dioxygenase family protein [Adhaeribacter swui]|uniref:Phytanoyl-CoA dioxygenase family protein n=1 Tax=Adhaeribacter swui TaxID=2086471 RepID=A0A7G7GC07_9BACT|nr:phytanoyl-CoA dioxygenase family protein [Adhaeribacter swui]QNF34691.1 phytanoyl-CoA dioxygenase family protein [Adhaeribacter swui]
METTPKKLTADQIDQFVQQGFVKIENAFPSDVAAEARAILWHDTGCNPHDPATWTQPVIRLGNYHQEPFRQAANTPVLHQAFNDLVGQDQWLPRTTLGTFPVRFPSAQDPADTGWHVDASFPGTEPENYLAWRINVKSRGRALLMLFLFSDVSEDDAPTRIKVSSHVEVACLLQPFGETGLSFMELATQLPTLKATPEVLATGPAGTVYLCHPFLVHAAQPHHGTSPRFLAQPPLHPRTELDPFAPGKTYNPVEKAIRLGLGLD